MCDFKKIYEKVVFTKDDFHVFSQNSENFNSKLSFVKTTLTFLKVHNLKVSRQQIINK
jgi:hypothetical protein